MTAPGRTVPHIDSGREGAAEIEASAAFGRQNDRQDLRREVPVGPAQGSERVGRVSGRRCRRHGRRAGARADAAPHARRRDAVTPRGSPRALRRTRRGRSTGSTRRRRRRNAGPATAGPGRRPGCVAAARTGNDRVTAPHVAHRTPVATASGSARFVGAPIATSQGAGRLRDVTVQADPGDLARGGAVAAPALAGRGWPRRQSSRVAPMNSPAVHAA